MPITYYCDDCGQLVHLDHVPTEQTSDGLVFNLVPAMRTHAHSHA